MKCPLCDSDSEPVILRSSGARTVEAKRCTQCNGFWFPRPLGDRLDITSVQQFETGAPNYSVQASDVVCPNDNTLLERSDHDLNPQSGQYWSCPDCNGQFFPRGQLALYTQWQIDNQPGTPAAIGAITRTQATTGILSISGLFVMVMASLSNLNYQAASTQTLPSTGPNVLTLLLLAVTYLAGTVLAVLGRKLPVILLGWGVIAICLVGFSVIIFGP